MNYDLEKEAWFWSNAPLILEQFALGYGCNHPDFGAIPYKQYKLGQ
ncbi:hypothetical protein [Mesobacillus maritimus]